MDTQYQAARPLCLCVFVVTFRLNVAPSFQKTVYGKANTTNDSLLVPRAPPAAAITATYCFPFFPRYVMGIGVMLESSFTDQSSFPVFDSNARKRTTFVAPMPRKPTAVTIGPPAPGDPTFCLPGGNVSLSPSGTCHAMSPVLPLIATSLAQGGLLQGQFATVRPFSSFTDALNAGPFTRVYGNSFARSIPGSYFGFF